MSLKQESELLHYCRVDKLCEGGMGVVWATTDTTLDCEGVLDWFSRLDRLAARNY